MGNKEKDFKDKGSFVSKVEELNETEVKKNKKKQLGGVLMGIAAGSGITLLSLYGMIDNFNKAYRDMYVYETDVENKFDLEKLENKEQLVANFMDRHTIFDKRDDLDYDSLAMMKVISQWNDDYAAYYNPEEAIEFAEENGVGFKGLGITMQKNMGTNNLMITDVFDGGEASKAGLQVGDTIVKVNDMAVRKWSASELSNYFKGKKDGTIKITVARGSETLSYNVGFSDVDYDYVNYEVKAGIPYIEFKKFMGNASGQFKEALIDLEDTIKETGSLIVDLRGNTGGDLSEAQKIAGYFIGKGKVICTLEGKNSSEAGKNSSEEGKNSGAWKNSGRKEVYKSTEDVIIPVDTKIVLLINAATASASELLTCTLQDYGLDVTTIGDVSYGKGIAQRLQVFFDGSMLKYTYGFYYSPKGRNIHDVGINPDILELDKEKQLERALEIAREKDK